MDEPQLALVGAWEVQQDKHIQGDACRLEHDLEGAGAVMPSKATSGPCSQKPFGDRVAGTLEKLWRGHVAFVNRCVRCTAAKVDVIPLLNPFNRVIADVTAVLAWLPRK